MKTVFCDTRYPSLATRHPSPVTRHPSPVTRHPLPSTHHPWKGPAVFLILLSPSDSILNSKEITHVHVIWRNHQRGVENINLAIFFFFMLDIRQWYRNISLLRRGLFVSQGDLGQEKRARVERCGGIRNRQFLFGERLRMNCIFTHNALRSTFSD